MVSSEASAAREPAREPVTEPVQPQAELPAPAPSDRPRRPRAVLAWLIVGVFIMSLNLRPAVASLPPIFTELRRQLGLSPVDVTMLATVPVLCFGLFSPVAAAASRRLGEERALGAALAAGAVGLALRALFPQELLLAGTVIAGGSIAFLNVLLPSLVKRREPRRANMLLGLYMVALYVGTIVSSAIVVPVYRATHGSLPVTLGLYALPMLAALAVWLPQLSHGAPHQASTPVNSDSSAVPLRPSRGHLLRNALAWQVTAFMGLQSLTYYATLSFLPEVFLSRGMAPGQAGLVGVILSIGGTVAAFSVPLLVHRSARIARVLMLATIAACAIGIAAPLLVPVGAALVLMVLLGLGQGAGITLALYFVMARAGTPRTAASLSAMSQGVGYVLAAAGPLAVGLLHAATGGWVVPVVALLAATAIEALAGVLAARHRTVPEPPAPAG
jgi:MFS transporter, CP family, cyanate transporter